MTEPGPHEPGDTVTYLDDTGGSRTGTVSSVQRIYQVIPAGTVGIVDEVLEAPSGH